MLKPFKYIHVVLIMIVLTLPVVCSLHANESVQRILTLTEALQIASEHDIQVLLAQERLVQALAQVEQRKSILYPQLNASSSGRRQTRDLRSSGIRFTGDPLVGPFNTFDARVELTQTIFDPATMARLKSAQAGEKLSEAQLRQTKEDVLALIADLYINARRSWQCLAYVEKLLAHATKKLEIIQQRINHGISADIEIKEIQAEFDAAVSFHQHMTNQALNTRLDLLAALGLDLNEAIQFADEDHWAYFAAQTEKDLTARDLPEMEVAKQNYLVSQYNHAKEKSAYFPKISAMADYGLSGVKPTDGSETYTLGVQATLPLFDGGFRRSSIKEAESKLKSSEANVRDVKVKLNAKIIQIHESVKQAEFLIIEKSSRLESVQKQTALIQKRLEDGTATEVEWLETAAQEAQALDQVNEAKAVLLTAQINWLHVLGKMGSLARRNMND